METLSALKPRHTVLCPERKLFDMQNGTWFVETIRASGLMRRANRPDTRQHLTKDQSNQKCLAKQEPSTQDKADTMQYMVSGYRVPTWLAKGVSQLSALE
jgi:hypothetical protein